jgi:Ribbon-helix-helix protein, copG family
LIYNVGIQYISGMRTIIEIPDGIAETLDMLCKKEKRPRVAVIREAITDYLNKKSQTGGDAAFGIWKNQPTEGVNYQVKLREEWSKR